MTQAPGASAAKPAPAVAPAPAPAARRRPADAATPQAPEDRGRPHLLNRWQVIAVAACVLFGVIVAGLQLLAWQAGDRAADNTEQLVRVQNIQSSLYRADALATNAFLIGGLEPPEQRAGVRRRDRPGAPRDHRRGRGAAGRPRGARRRSTSASRRTPPGSTQARDNNRQGFPVGAEYLRDAGGRCAARRCRSRPRWSRPTPRAPRTRWAPSTRRPAPAGAARARGAVAGQPRASRGGSGAGSTWACGRRARLAVLTLVAVVLRRAQSGANDDLRDGTYKEAVDEASARTAANDAKANESLRLIKRGSGQVYEDAWAAADETVEDDTRSAAPGAATRTTTRRSSTLDTDGDWDDAVDLATSSGQDGSTAAFDGVRRAVARGGLRVRRQEPPASSGPAASACSSRWSRSLVGLPPRGPPPGASASDGRSTHEDACAARPVAVGRAPRRLCGYDETPVPEPTPEPPPRPPPPPRPAVDVRRRPCAPTRPTAPAGPGDCPRSHGEDPERGRLIAGVSADTFLLGSRNPLTGGWRASTSTWSRQWPTRSSGPRPDR